MHDAEDVCGLPDVVVDVLVAALVGDLSKPRFFGGKRLVLKISPEPGLIPEKRWNDPGLGLRGPGLISGSHYIRPGSEKPGPNRYKDLAQAG